MYVRPVGDAVRVCEFEITMVCLRIRSSPDLMPGFGFWADVRLSGPNSVNAFVMRRLSILKLGGKMRFQCEPRPTYG